MESLGLLLLVLQSGGARIIKIETYLELCWVWTVQYTTNFGSERTKICGHLNHRRSPTAVCTIAMRRMACREWWTKQEVCLLRQGGRVIRITLTRDAIYKPLQVHVHVNSSDTLSSLRE